MPSNLHGRARYANLLIHSNQGGGNKKAGLYNQVGVDSWTAIAYGKSAGNCGLALSCVRTWRANSNACVSRSIGSRAGNVYYHC